jgi:transaldolase
MTLSTRIQRIHELGQSIWCDNLSRKMIESGELQRLIDLGIVGVTSNPTIFMKAITGGSDYDDAFQKLIDAGSEDMALYEGLVLPDIRDAADLLRPVYDRTGGVDGYVSLEVNPKLAFDTEATIDEARRLFAELDRPNVFIKVPATDPGIPAIATLIGEGVNVNVTLIFAISMYRKVMDAYIAGLAKLDAGGGDVTNVASVASFFVSRVDTLVDKKLQEEQAGGANVDHLFGKAANANAKLAYRRFQETFEANAFFNELAIRGARVQRPLWASTSTKNPDYPDTLYVDPLIGPHTVNTLPPNTIEVVLDHGRAEVTLTEGVEDARRVLAELGEIGIDMKAVTDRLTQEGVQSFTQSFDDLLADLTRKRTELRSEPRAPATGQPVTSDNA